MRKLILQILTVLVFTTSVFSQTNSENPIIVDEFGLLPLDDLMVRLDAAVYELQNRNGDKLQIKIYGGDADYLARPYVFGSILEGFLKVNRKLSSERFFIEQCNVNKEDIRTQIYVVPQGGKLSKCDENLEIPTKTVLFNSLYFYSKEITFVPVEDSELDIMGSVGDYSRSAFAVLKKILENSHDSKIYLVSYLQVSYETNDDGKIIKKNVDKKSLAGKMRQTVKDGMVKIGFDATRIEFVEGGYKTGDYERRMEIWFVPKNGEIPKPKPDYFPKKINKN